MSNEREAIESRAVSTLQALQVLGFSPGIAVLVVFCVAIVYYGAQEFRLVMASSYQYQDDMTTLVSGIQDDLRAAMKRMNDNTRGITRVSAIMIDAGILPIYMDEETGRSYIETKRPRL